MRNLKMKKKLIVSFSVVIGMLVVIGLIGVYGIKAMDDTSSDMYVNKASPLGNLTVATEYFQRIRVQTLNSIIYAGNTEQLQIIENDVNQRINTFREELKIYRPTITAESGIKTYDGLMDKFNNVYEPGAKKILADSKAGVSQEQLITQMREIVETANLIANDLTDLVNTRMEVMSEANDAGTKLGNVLFVAIIVFIIVAIVVSLVFAMYIAKIISTPLVFIKTILYEMGARGRVDFSDEEYKAAEALAVAKDEAGESIQMLINTGRRLEAVGKSLERIADGDLTEDINLLSESDTIGNSLKTMLGNLNNMFGEINTATEQVSTGSRQVADGSQGLAQGSTEQAASVEELSSSIADIAEKTKVNSDMADKAATLAETIKDNAEKGNKQMDDMISAVHEINQASQSISNVIKVIDDIAFQTNILALNAAVEAARAGEAGKGFAVVAEEVRNLAAKSGEAAKNTGSLIANSMEKAQLGASIANMTAESLSEIVSGINESAKIVSDIAESSKEQSGAIVQINLGIEQVAQVVQQNSATAEESAAASEEMNGQADMLKSLVAQFRIK